MLLHISPLDFWTVTCTYVLIDSTKKSYLDAVGAEWSSRLYKNTTRRVLRRTCMLNTMDFYLVIYYSNCLLLLCIGYFSFLFSFLVYYFCNLHIFINSSIVLYRR